jgi:membrane protease YdiL (CAAX protease family)
MQALVPVGLLALAAIVRPLRLPILIALGAAYLLARRRETPFSQAIAGALAVAAILAFGALPQPSAMPDASGCTDVLAPPAVWRFLEAAVGLAVVAAVLHDRHGRWRDLGIRLGSGRLAVIATAGLVIVTPVALMAAALIGSELLGGAFFGTYRLDLSRPVALLPALIFAASNALAEELSYRGAMRVWLQPSLGVVGANLAQALVFGLGHSGPDFVGSVAPVAAAMVTVGFIAGVIARRTGSLTLPLAIHAAADIPIYYFWACRLA